MCDGTVGKISEIRKVDYCVDHLCECRPCQEAQQEIYSCKASNIQRTEDNIPAAINENNKIAQTLHSLRA